MPTDNKSSKRVIKRPAEPKRSAANPPAAVDQTRTKKTRASLEPAATRPPNKREGKSIKRVKKLFSDMKSLAAQPPASGIAATGEQVESPSAEIERAAFQQLAENTETRRQIEALKLRILELETQQLEGEKIVAAQAKETEAKPASSIL
jgi:hypothetical protein